MARATVLEIVKHGDEYRFRLTRSGQPFMAMKKVWTVRPDPVAVSAVCRRIVKAVETANQSPDQPGLNSTPFKDAGRSLYKELFASADPRLDQLRDALRRLRSPLLISIDDPSMFWELLYDEHQEEFLGLRYSMGRQLHSGSVPGTAAKSRESWRCLLIADPNPDEPQWALPGTAAAVRQLQAWLKRRNIHDIDYLEGEEATFDALLRLLDQHEYNVIHYAGHTVYHKKTGEKTGEHALRLHGGIPFPASSIRNHVRGCPVVFLNGCWTGVARGVSSPRGAVEGLTDAFLHAGAQLVLGSQFEAPIAGARAFAEKFYDSILDGKLVGEAVRLARQHVMEKPEYGAAWTCFVMYGDPCLQLSIQEDLLQKLLATVNLQRDDFDEACLHVVEQALEYSGNSEVVATVELFAAMVDSESDWMRDRLEEQQAPVETLRDAFQSAVKEINASAQRKKKPAPKFSANAKAIVTEAHQIAKTDNRKKISEGDLIKGFVRKQGGSTGKILIGLGVDVQKLDPDGTRPQLPKPPRTLEPVVTASPPSNSLPPSACPALHANEFTREAWSALMHAAELAQHSQNTLLGTPQFFFGLLHNQQSPLAKALRRLNLVSKLQRKDFGVNGEHSTAVSPITRSEALSLSKSVRTILDGARTAAAAAGRGRISEQDLLEAFVHQGGGTIGQALRKKGLPLESLTSKLFGDDGSLDLARFTPSARAALARAKEVAAEKGHAALGRHHLFCAMFGDEKSILSALLHREGSDLTMLSDLLYTEMRADVGTALTEAPSTVSPRLATVLCLAETEAKRRQEKEITEVLLLLFLLKHSNDIGQKLAKERVRWQELIRKVQQQI